MSARMVDISPKDVVLREAVAEGYIKLKPNTIERIRKGEIEKGDVIAVAKVAGIMAAKKTPELLPMCHPIPLEYVNVEVELEEDKVKVRSTIRAHYKTGVEMEALTSVSVALLTVWDMTKQYEKDENGQYPSTSIEGIKIVSKVKSF